VPEGIPWEAFRRQVLLSITMGGGPPHATYYSEPFDALDYASLSYWFQVSYSLPGTLGPACFGAVETAMTKEFEAPVELASGIVGAMGTISTGTVTDLLRWVRVRIDFQQPNEVTTLAFRCVLRRAV
jgi:hypothetical protein